MKSTFGHFRCKQLFHFFGASYRHPSNIRDPREGPAPINSAVNQTYAINSYLYIDSIEFVVFAMHRGQHNYDKSYSGRFVHSRVIGMLENVVKSNIRD